MKPILAILFPVAAYANGVEIIELAAPLMKPVAYLFALSILAIACGCSLVVLIGERKI